MTQEPLERCLHPACSPSAGSRWHLMHTKHGHVHCELRVCSFTPLVTGDNAGAWYVKYYAIGKKHEVECHSSLAEWNDLVKRGRIREANVSDQATEGAAQRSNEAKKQSNSK